ncbi:MAG: serine hydrolase domain-containing protein [Hyphomonadaceae bacterium]
MAVMHQVEAGHVDLDAPVSGYLDAFENRGSGAITIRQLLSHTSGFSTLQGNDTRADRPAGRRHARAPCCEHRRMEPRVRSRHPLGIFKRELLDPRRVIEAVSGQDYAHYVETEILEPIGMNDSFVADGERYAEMAVGHQPWFGGKRPLRDSAASRATARQRGGVVATASDMALWSGGHAERAGRRHQRREQSRQCCARRVRRLRRTAWLGDRSR